MSNDNDSTAQPHLRPEFLSFPQLLGPRESFQYAISGTFENVGGAPVSARHGALGATSHRVIAIDGATGSSWSLPYAHMGGVTRRRERRLVVTSIEHDPLIAMTTATRAEGGAMERLIRDALNWCRTHSAEASAPVQPALGPVAASSQVLEVRPAAPAPSAQATTAPTAPSIKHSVLDYEESLGFGDGVLRVTPNYWSVYFYFPGPDRRYNGTLVQIQSTEIESYINAYRENFRIYRQAKVGGLTGTLEIGGAASMTIRTGGFAEGVCLRKYHLPLRTEPGINEAIAAFERAPRRAAEIQGLLRSM